MDVTEAGVPEGLLAATVVEPVVGALTFGLALLPEPLPDFAPLTVGGGVTPPAGGGGVTTTVGGVVKFTVAPAVLGLVGVPAFAALPLIVMLLDPLPASALNVSFATCESVVIGVPDNSVEVKLMLFAVLDAPTCVL